MGNGYLKAVASEYFLPGEGVAASYLKYLKNTCINLLSSLKHSPSHPGSVIITFNKPMPLQESQIRLSLDFTGCIINHI